ncbi:MAG TPA: threonine/serine dehydratase [Gammaproteobacteria bacterium]|jgi:threonine dehydratase
MQNVVPTIDDVVAASQRLGGWLLDTPVLESEQLNELCGVRVLVKAESLQLGGSFKIRGALNRMLSLSYDERRNGVVAYSSGNHAQAVALAAKWLGVRATVVMPKDAPETKTQRARELGAEIVSYDRYRDDREKMAGDIVAARGAVLVPPFDHADVVAGQGTVGLELAAAARARNIELKDVYVPCSGGGLVAGCALALRAAYRDCAVHAVEPEGYDDMAKSLAAGTRQFVGPSRRTVCDALQAAAPGAIPFAIAKDLLAGGVSVDDGEVMRAVAFAATHLKLVAEPSGAVGLAAVLKQPRRSSGAIAIVVSGGNVDASLLRRALDAHPNV